MNLLNTHLSDCFKAKKVVKVITGIDNVNISQIVSMVKAAELSGATYIDVVANPKIVKLLKTISSMPICVSSISPIDLYNCVVSGADLVEIGNFDAFYKKGIYISSNQILQLVKEIKLLVNSIDICVTIPYHLSIGEQIKLAQALEFMGISFIQTESMFIKNKVHMLKLYDNDIVHSIHPSYSSLLSTYFISMNVQIPILTSSSINTISSALALSFGASGIGVSSIIRNKNDLPQMSYYVKLLYDSVNFMVDQQPLSLDCPIYCKNLLHSDIIKGL
uniref:Uncharacterized protein ycf23 n=1 Tax=Palisada sp. TaxID=1955416 RepID=A0A1Z1MRE1_9FLOR|nr:hypothetical protein [Palisada sp.]